MDKKERVLTELQKKFLDFLFDEAAGDPKTAMKLAGYSDNARVKEIIDSLKDEIIELSKNVLALHAPEASLALIFGMRQPNSAGVANKMKAAEQILNRVGVSDKNAGDINLKVPENGLIILPAKDAIKSGTDNSKSE